mmetsp:Transcript_9444/g.10760  ORF Transcript_9444/g.10760 Transcript_9444/m.10760 type:complete len:85 (-) Transcript_9444:1174-1428(-)
MKRREGLLERTRNDIVEAGKNVHLLKNGFMPRKRGKDDKERTLDLIRSTQEEKEKATFKCIYICNLKAVPFFQHTYDTLYLSNL